MVFALTSNEYSQFDFWEFHGLLKDYAYTNISIMHTQTNRIIRPLWNVIIDFSLFVNGRRRRKIDWISLVQMGMAGKKATKSIFNKAQAVPKFDRVFGFSNR